MGKKPFQVILLVVSGEVLTGHLRTTSWLLSEVEKHVLLDLSQKGSWLELDSCGAQSSASGGAALVRGTNSATA